MIRYETLFDDKFNKYFFVKLNTTTNIKNEIKCGEILSIKNISKKIPYRKDKKIR